MEEELTLTLKDRILLANQYLILEHLCPDKDDAEVYRRRRIIVEEGYEIEYDYLYKNTFDAPVSLQRSPKLISLCSPKVITSQTQISG